MKILSNNHLSNLPGSKKIIHGGTAKFARFFYPIMAKKCGAWVNVVDRYIKDMKATFHGKTKGACWWSVSVPHTFVKSSSRYRGGDKIPQSASRLINLLSKIIKSEAPDIVFLNGLSHFNWALLQAASRMGTPVVVQHAGLWGVEMDLYKERFTSGGLKAIKAMEKDFAKIPARNIFLNKMSADKFEDLVAPVSSSRKRIVPLPYSIKENHKPNKAKSHKKPKKSYNLGMVARWDRIKNHEAFLALAVEARKEGLPWNFYSITSIPPTNFRKEYKEEYKKHIKVYPPKPYATLRKFYRRMDLMVLPSHFDVSPGVVIEAAIEGVSTAISPNVGYCEVLRKNNGRDFIIDFSNSKKALGKMKKIIGRSYPKQLLKTLISEHNPRVAARHYMQIFTEAVKNP